MDVSAVLKAFNKEKIVTIVLLATWLSCSVATARRRLKQWGAYTSYNHNGRYYVNGGQVVYQKSRRGVPLTAMSVPGHWRQRRTTA